MSLLQIPLSATDANQSIQVVLDGSTAYIDLMTTDEGLFMTLTYGTTKIMDTRLCRDRTNLNPYTYLGLPQPLFFADLQGASDPEYADFNTRYLLLYGTPDS
jgi:hypothetical protein